MNLFGKKSSWKKVVVHLWGLEQHDLQMCGWDFTDRLWKKTAAPMFFAHYSNPNGEARVEIKVELDWSAQQFEQFFASQNVSKVTVEDFNASPAHALAYLLSRELRGKGEVFTKDVLHWALNMTGYSYAQEMRILAEHIAHMAENIEK
jgi:hypothetical protein